MFASPTSSSSSSPTSSAGRESKRVSAIEAAAQGAARRARRLKPSDDAVAAYIAVERAQPDEASGAATNAQGIIREGAGALTDPGGSGSGSKTGGSRYIGKLVASALARREEAERLTALRMQQQRQLHDAAFPQKGRFVTKSYAAALRRRAEAEAEAKREAWLLRNDPQLAAMKAAPHAAALRFAVADAAATALQNSAAKGAARAPLANENESGPDVEMGAAVGASVALEFAKSTQPHEQAQSQTQTQTQSQPQSELHPQTEKQSQSRGIDTSSEGPVRRRRPSRFASDADNSSQPVNEAVNDRPENLSKPPKHLKKHGLRRNDGKSIEAYRQRYLQRRATRLASGVD